MILIDILTPENNELELALMAKELGLKEVIFLYDSPVKKPMHLGPLPVKVHFGLFINNFSEINKSSGFEFIFAPCRREFVESKKVTHLIDAESEENSDSFHQRRSGLDEAMCKLAKENGKTIVFDTGQIQVNNLALGRMIQNARLCRKYKLNFLVATFASKPLEMRSLNDIKGFARMIKLI
jgi:hypothetical protein